jgi:transcriptional regulator with XRE-family HTH domain
VRSPLGEKIRELRGKKGLSLEDLATLTQSSKSYIWELENKDDPRPSADKLNKIAAALDVTADYLMSADTTPPEQEVVDQAFFRKYQGMPEGTKKRLRKILDTWDDDE